MGLAISSISKNQTDSTLNENTSPFPDEVLKNMPHIQEGMWLCYLIFPSLNFNEIIIQLEEWGPSQYFVWFLLQDLVYAVGCLMRSFSCVCSD